MELLNSHQVAELLGIHVNVLREKILAGWDIPCFRLGTGTRARLRFPKKELEDWIQKQLKRRKIYVNVRTGKVEYDE